MRYVRLGLISVVVLAVIGLARVNGSTDTKQTKIQLTEQQAGRFPLATTSGASTVDSVWYCAAGQVRGRLESTHDVIISNPTDEVVKARLTAAPLVKDDAAKVKPKDVEVPAHAVVTVSTGDLGTPNPVAVTAEVLAGEAAVEHRITTAQGVDQQPCASRVSEEWHFAYSNTEKDGTSRLFVFNPLSVTAIVDVTTSTPESVRIPNRMNGVIVAAGQVKELNINESALRWSHVALSVRARSGFVVAELVQSFDESNIEYNQKYGESLGGPSGPSGTSGPSGASGASGTTGTAERLIDETTGEAPFARQGIALVPGVPDLVPRVQFLDGYRHQGVREWVVLYNPNRENAIVNISILPLTAAELAPEPVQKTVPPGRVEIVRIEEDQRIPDIGFHRIEVSTMSKVNVVSSLVHMISDERTEGQDTGQRRPSVPTGLTITPGTPVAASRWIAPSYDISAEDEGWLFVNNPSASSIALVTVTKMVDGVAAPVDGMNPLELAPATQTAIEISPGPTVIYKVEAEQYVTVERRWTDHETGDISASSAVPAGDSVLDLASAAK